MTLSLSNWPKSNKLSDVQTWFISVLQPNYAMAECKAMFRLVVKHFFQIESVQIAMLSDKLFSESELLKIDRVIRHLQKGEPLQYILGETEFCGLRIKVNEHVLIPRPETEELVTLIKQDCKDTILPSNMLDIATGSGCIALGLKHFLPSASIQGLDISAPALAIARHNAEINNLAVTFEQADALNLELTNYPQLFDVIVSNPPYICESERDKMASNVVDFEPAIALFVPNDNPLLFYEAIAHFAAQKLSEKGGLYLEVNASLANETAVAVQTILNRKADVLFDLSGNKRFVVVRG